MFFSYINYGELLPVFGESCDTSSVNFICVNPEVLLLTGIANPFPLKNKVEELKSFLQSEIGNRITQEEQNDNLIAIWNEKLRRYINEQQNFAKK